LIRKAQREEKEEKKFQEELAKEKQDIQEYRDVLKEQFGGAQYSCSLSSVHEMWCSSCKCAFDIFKPFVAKYCPVCAGKVIEAREAGWYPGKRV
jgi:hypothetical protein